MIIPRKKESTQWTPLPEELQTQIEEVFQEQFAEEYDLGSFRFLCQGQIYKEEVVIRVGLNSPKQLKQHNFDLSLSMDKKESSPLALIQKGINYFSAPFTELLEEDFNDREFSREWIPIEKASHQAHIKYCTDNSLLDQEADRLLDEYEKKLVYNDNPESPSPMH